MDETGKEKVRQICEVLRKETLEPAMEEAKQLVAEAKSKANSLIDEARAKTKKMIADAEEEIEKRQNVFKASINQAARQSIEWLKQEIEEHFLNQNLSELIAKSTSSPEILAEMIKAIIRAIEEERLETDLSVYIPSIIEARSVNELLGKKILERLKEKSVLIGHKKGGIEVKLHKENITIDISDTALVDLMTRYIRKDFHQFFFVAK